MAGNTIGKLFRVTTFGESHGAAIGVVIDGCPPGIDFDQEFIRLQMSRRRPGQSSLTTTRQEKDLPEVLSGVFEGKTLGTPIAMIIRNTDARSSDYDALKDVYRPSHADFTWQSKYGIRDHRGGGRASARETAARVMGGAVAQMILGRQKIEIRAYVSSVKDIEMPGGYVFPTIAEIDATPVRCPNEASAELMQEIIEDARSKGDSVGGVVSCVVRGCPVGFGEPVFDKLQAGLAHALMNIPAAKGIEFGSGFGITGLFGSEANDLIMNDKGKITTATNHSGGIQGGISNGMDISFRIAFKPPSTISKEQQTINQKGEAVLLKAVGRHDPCVLPRVVPVVEAMAAIVVADHLLFFNSIR